MPGRLAKFTDNQPIGEALREEGFKVEVAFEKEGGRYNISQSMPVTVATRVGDCIVLRPVLWGYRPEWASDDAELSINARIETVAANNFFREAFFARRAAVPVDGWYDWQAGTPKVPHYYSRYDQKIVWLAAVYSQRGFAILTRPAVGPMAAINERMPMCLEASCLADWLSPDITTVDEIRAATRPMSTATLTVWPVGREVNKTANEGPELIQIVPSVPL